MSSIIISNLGKFYKSYPNKWSRLVDWIGISRKKNYKIKTVLHDINFTIGAGESVGIIGVNGAGKSTLLKLITGTSQPTSGQINVNGRIAALLELGIGFHPDFTGRQNVYMAGQLLGYSTDEIDILFPDIEKFAEIGEYIEQPLRMYSSGMQARLAFAVATARMPDILIVDEALSVGDVYFQAKCYSRISEYKKRGMTLLLVSHAVMDISKQCDRAIFLKAGSVYADGPSREVVNLYMDDLFGKKKEETNTNNGKVIKFNQQIDDIYHTRPGYLKDEYRWGQGGAKIIDFSLTVDGEEYPTVINTNDKVDIYIKVFFEKNFDYITPGILIKSLEGVFIYGSNSHLATTGKALISGKMGNVAVYKFTLNLCLNEGSYLLSLGVSSGDPTQTTDPVDRRYDSILLKVTNNIHMWGLIDMKADFLEIEEVI
ncbi:TPA: ABC transporter ATP-binding protein [Pluralibacter gergoviae]|nr:ABC transporter ATP-binding protein [Pluralibacter gergoviae]HDS1239678.1 ABC transporter ATP-binding protein [Pluralibacter gergoviae]HDS1245399.1 ABC transporter ATP-binding protein [Pluralibacter gergoviae]HDS1250937.1 ABC transporter ATP-binding protein [Pluralibacter gergoviae]HDS1256193.1 ABC transporter ATP-binding protein [Pluralibacter gergoviae]